MIYTKLTKQAMRIAYDAHHNHQDKSGTPYIYHVMHLAEEMNDELSVVVALLHDVLEDSEMSLKNIKDYGFPQAVLDALSLFSHDKDRDYMHHIRMIKANEIARRVKLADLQHNSDITRLDTVEGDDMIRLLKYKMAIELLQSEE